jgi:hypothetical protein
MAETFNWLDKGGERILYLDDPATPGARFLAVRRGLSEDDWSSACVLERGAQVQEVGEGLLEGMAEDAILKFAIQGLARLHGVSSAPGLLEEEATEAEVTIAKLWQILTARWAPPGA